MSAATKTRIFRVFLHTWEVHETTVEATSAEEAEAIAAGIYATHDLEGFSYFNSGDDGFYVEPLEDE